jgi:DNA-binding NarL/FixJ family response regulator
MPSASKPLKILIVDSRPDQVAALGRSLSTFGTLEVVGDAGFGPVASTWAHTLDPAIVIVSVEEPLTRSLTTIQTLMRGNPRWTVVGMVSQFDGQVFRQTVLAGARGCAFPKLATKRAVRLTSAGASG